MVENKKITRAKIAQDDFNAQIVFQAVEATLSEISIPRYYYSFEKLYDDSYSVIKEGNKWLLLYYERGNKHCIYVDTSVEKTCEKLIEKLAPNDLKSKAVIDYKKRCKDNITILPQSRKKFATQNCSYVLSGNVIKKTEPVSSRRKKVTTRKNMNKQELIAAISKQSGLSKKDATAAVAAFTRTVTKELAKKGKVQLVGFGTFDTIKHAARVGIDPQTGASITIPSSTAPRFKAGKQLKSHVNQKKK